MLPSDVFNLNIRWRKKHLLRTDDLMTDDLMTDDPNAAGGCRPTTARTHLVSFQLLVLLLDEELILGDL